MRENNKRQRVREKESKSKSKNMMDEKYFREVGMGTVLVYLLRDRKVSTGLLLVHRPKTERVLKRERQIKDRESEGEKKVRVRT